MSDIESLLREKKDKSLKIVKNINKNRLNQRILFANRMQNFREKMMR